MSDTPQKTNRFAELLKQYGWLIVLAVMVAHQFGWITKEQADAIKNVVPVGEQQAEESQQLVEGEKKPKPKPPVVDPVPANQLTPEQWAKLIAEIIDRLKPVVKPEPVKPPVPDVTPVEPPASDPKILIVDETGKPITSGLVEPGQLFRVSAINASADIGWQPVKHGAVKLSVSTDGREYVGSLESGQWIDFGLTDFASRKQLSARVACNQAPQPPPVVPDVKPVDPVTPTAGSLSLRVLHDVTDITADTALVLNAYDAWNEVAGDGDWLFVDVTNTEREANNVKADASGTTVPALVIYDKTTGRKLAAMPLPKSVDALKETVAKYQGGK